MQCNQCRREIADDAAFCPYCGERITPTIVPSSAAEPAAGFAPNVSPTTPPHPSAATERLKQESTRFGSKDPLEEEQLWSGAYSPKAMLGQVILTLITVAALVGVALYFNKPIGWTALGIGVAILWAALGLALLYRRLTVQYRLTRFRLFQERGLLSRVIDRIETIDIDDVTVRQGPIERMLGIGTILIASTDRTEPQLKMIGIDHVTAVADLIDSTRRAERQRRGLHLEAT